LNLTQAGLATRANAVTRTEADAATISERTVAALERRTTPANWVSPRPSTVSTLAKVFELTPGSNAAADFVSAARFRTGSEHFPQTPTAWTTPRPDVSPTGSADPVFIVDGREAHLARLQQAVEAAADGQPGVILVHAAAGTGKTSLIAHAARQAIATIPNLVVLWGDSSDHTVTAGPYGPVRQIFGILIGDQAAAGPGQLLHPVNAQRIRERIPVAMQSLADDGHSLARQFVPPRVLESQSTRHALSPSLRQKLQAVVSTPAPPNTDEHPEQLFRLFAHYASAGPTVIVIEDLHWATPRRIAMLTHIFQRLRDRQLPILVIGSYRPLSTVSAGPDSHPLQRLLNALPRMYPDSILDLSNAVGGEPGKAFVDALTAHTVGPAADGFRQALFDQTGGLPLFVVGMLRWFQSAGIDPAGDAAGRWDPGIAELPSEIDALFAEQVGRLAPRTQTLLELASVQGEWFSAQLAGHAMDMTPAELIATVDGELSRRFGMVEPGRIAIVAGYRSHVYRFSHGLLREYLYHRMTDLEREFHHAATAETLVELMGPGPHEGSYLIARHFEAAGDTLRAAQAHLKAGDHAMEQTQYDQASHHFEAARLPAVRTSDPYTYAQASVGLGNCARGLGHYDAASRHFDRALDTSRRLGVRLVEANALTSRAMLDFDAGQMQAGADRLSAAVRILLDLRRNDEACRSLALLSHTVLGGGRFDEAIQAAERAVGLATDLHDDMLLVTGLTALANCWMEFGLYDRALAMYRRGVRLCNDHHNTHRANVCLLNITLCQIEQDRLDDAGATIAAVRTPGRAVIERLQGAAAHNAGLLAERCGDIHAARREHETSLAIRQRLGQHALAVDSLAGLLRIAILTSDHPGMRAFSHQIQHHVQRQGYDGIEHMGRMHLALIDAELAAGNVDGARAQMHAALAELARRAGTLSDSSLRVSFLRAVPSHRRLVEMAAELGVPVPPPIGDGEETLTE
jgi:tetratricopeptide (TPR) repeat protein